MTMATFDALRAGTPRPLRPPESGLVLRWVVAVLLLGCSPSRARGACSSTAPASAPAVAIEGITDATQIGLSGEQACVVRRGGEVACWPIDWSPSAASGGVLRPALTTVGGLRHAKRISVALGHACVVEAPGAIACWGSFPHPSLDEADAPDLPARRVTDVADAIDVSTTLSHTCAVRQTGQVVCWGDPDMGRLGGPAKGNRAVVVAGIDPASEVVAADLGACAVGRTGRLFCWGGGYIGAWTPDTGGDPDRRSKEEIVRPAPLPGVSDVVGFGSGLGRCILRRSGHVRCWDHDARSMIDPKATAASRDAPGLDDGVRIRGTLVLRATGEIVNVSPWRATEPVACEIRDAVDMAGSVEAGCAVRKTGAVACWSDTWRTQDAAAR